MLLTANVYIDMFTVFVVAIISLILYIKWTYKYWERLGVPYIKPTIPFGTLSIVKREAYAYTISGQYKEARAMGYQYVGLFGFTIPQLMIIDPVMVKNILVKDFNHFVDRGVYFNEELEPLTAHLFALEGLKWKNLRAKLTPTFTSGKMKIMFNTVLQCANQLEGYVDANCTEGPVDIKYVMESYTIDVIGSCAFGLNSNSFTDPSSDFCKYARKIFSPTPYETFKQIIGHLFPSFLKSLRIPVMAADYRDFFTTILNETVEYRQKTGNKRNDFLQILINLMSNENADEDHKTGTITLAELTAQSFFFFAAGYETSSTVMTFSLLELARNPDLQEKVRDEVNAILDESGTLLYESLNDMKYMSAVMDEALRMYPPVVILNRICTIDYKMPDSDLFIKKGTQIVIPALAMQNDPEYYPEPEQFDPTRFAKENKDTLASLPYMPFGEGPRTCIGLRFGAMQAKIGLAILLKHFKFSLSNITTLPVKISPKSFLLVAEGGVWLNVERI